MQALRVWIHPSGLGEPGPTTVRFLVYWNNNVPKREQGYGPHAFRVLANSLKTDPAHEMLAPFLGGGSARVFHLSFSGQTPARRNEGSPAVHVLLGVRGLSFDLPGPYPCGARREGKAVAHPPRPQLVQGAGVKPEAQLTERIHPLPWRRTQRPQEQQGPATTARPDGGHEFMLYTQTVMRAGCVLHGEPASSSIPRKFCFPELSHSRP